MTKVITLITLFMLLMSWPAHAADWDMSKTIPMPYAAVKVDTSLKESNRKMLRVRIVLAEKDSSGKVVQRGHSDDLSKEQLAATVIAAAKFYANDIGSHIVGVVLDSQYSDKGHGSSILAKVDYAPDGKGITGKENWKYNMATTKERGLSKRELAIERLWGEMRGQYQTSHGTTDEEALTKAIAEKLGIDTDAVDLPYMWDIDVPVEFAERVK